jgi:NADH-quinone oxidoreductase subunit J
VLIAVSTQKVRCLMNLLPPPWNLIVPVALGAVAILLLLPRPGKRPWLLGGLCGIVAGVLGALSFGPTLDDLAMDGLFYLFAGGAMGSGVMMITDRNPVYSALWFAVVTLSTCGLFLLNSAPFLSAATIIVYAGAIVVTFVFVIMLAQQAGEAKYDQRARQPTIATATSCLMLGAILYTLAAWGGKSIDDPELAESAPAASQFLLPQAGAEGNLLSLPVGDDLGSLRGVGRSLFGDYLYSVEIAGSILLIATIGAIALAPRRAQGQL